MEPLVVINETFGRVVELPEGDTVIGRSDTCDITIPRGSVAQRHACIARDADTLTIHDNSSTNGTYVQSGDRPAAKIGTQPVPLVEGDVVFVGPARLVIRHADWIGDKPPGAFPVDPLPDSLDVLDGVIGGEPTSTFSTDALDSAWVSGYLRWRTLPGSDTIFALAAQICSPRMLAAIREALDDPVRWFVDYGIAATEALLKSPHPIGFLLALDIRLRHTGRGFREAAGKGIRKAAQKQAASIPDLATLKFLSAFDPAAADHDLFCRLATDVIESARKEGRTWSTETWATLMASPAFMESAENFVFVERSRDEHFRPTNGELLTLNSHITLRPDDQIGVAMELDAAWSEHLADYEIVQPFPQQITA